MTAPPFYTLLLLLCSILPRAASADIFEIRLQKSKYGGYRAPPPLPVGCRTEYLSYTERTCFPYFERRCKREKRKTLTPVEGRNCVSVSVPACKVVEGEVELKACGTYYEQVGRSEEVRGAAADYAKRCEFRNATVCPYRPPPHYPDRYFPPHTHAHHCREEGKTTCFKVPIVRPTKHLVPLSFAEPRQNCTTVRTSVPRVVCREVEQEKQFCHATLELEEGEKEVEECSVSFDEDDGSGKTKKRCQEVVFKVPKTVCKERPGPILPEEDY